MDFKTYLTRLGSDLKAGNATEHTHRPALQALIESAAADIRATNEPRRIACSAPDYIVSHLTASNRVDKVSFEDGRVSINAEQYFDGVPEAVWNYHIGGYQVAHKWLKDCKGRLLSFADLQHYQRVISALAETIQLQAEIDKAIPAWPLV